MPHTTALPLPALPRPAVAPRPTHAPEADPVTVARLRALLAETGALRPGEYVDAPAAELAARVLHLDAERAALEPLARLGLATLHAAERGESLAPPVVLAAMRTVLPRTAHRSRARRFD